MKKKKKPIFETKDLNLDAIVANTNKFIQENMPWIKTPEPCSKTKKRIHRAESQFISK